jgi:hypothetical protein
MSSDPTLFEEETRPTFQDPLWRGDRRSRAIGTVALHPYNDGQVPHVKGSDTSKAAAMSMEPQLGTKQARVLELIRQHPGGLTDDQLETLTGWRHQTVSARRRELVLAERVADSGERRRTSSGRMATVWVAA